MISLRLFGKWCAFQSGGARQGNDGSSSRSATALDVDQLRSITIMMYYHINRTVSVFVMSRSKTFGS